MNKDNNAYLEDMLISIHKIEQYTQNSSYESFLEEPMRQDAIIRHLEIIGEAAAKLSDDFVSKHPDFPVKEAINMRNFLIHGYDQVNIDVVWKTIQRDIPLLKNEINKTLT